jgi:hypothetical protein
VLPELALLGRVAVDLGLPVQVLLLELLCSVPCLYNL